MEHLSNCCEALFYDPPGWPDTDICSKCKEHACSQAEEDIADMNQEIQKAVEIIKAVKRTILDYYPEDLVNKEDLLNQAYELLQSAIQIKE